MATRVMVVLAVIAALFLFSAQGHPPLSSYNCPDINAGLVDCLSYVSTGSDISSPPTTCCTGVVDLFKNSHIPKHCFCHVLEIAAENGFSVNMTRSLDLPVACSLKTIKINCRRINVSSSITVTVLVTGTGSTIFAKMASFSISRCKHAATFFVTVGSSVDGTIGKSTKIVFRCVAKSPGEFSSSYTSSCSYTSA
ncbi:non-specific lipid-transfer protein-like protein [Canna indica]|uniref:Non-specific lipid-transfer protein-like protein n=1 Tax=Canna indica TaxID=4628 RepID=A0AAQ3JP98_9LILI|nr:non-specific lipid-transfer protein-like protein [Canna indica]